MNPLSDVMDHFRMEKANHKMVVKLLKKDPSLFPPDSPYFSKPLSALKKDLERALDEIEDLTVISLFFLFERIILDHLINKANNIKNQFTDAFSNRIINHGLKEPGRWKMEDVLDLYKDDVNSELIGQVKQVYKYRNWVAHGKRGKKPSSIDPRSAFERLSRFLEQARLIEVHCNSNTG